MTSTEACYCKLSRLLLLLLPFFGFSVLAPAVQAHIGDFDEVWQKRAEEAQKAAFAAFNPHPEEVTNLLNKNARRSVHIFILI